MVSDLSSQSIPELKIEEENLRKLSGDNPDEVQRFRWIARLIALQDEITERQFRKTWNGGSAREEYRLAPMFGDRVYLVVSSGGRSTGMTLTRSDVMEMTKQMQQIVGGE